MAAPASPGNSTFSYDYANRLTAADHWTHNGTVWTNTNNYSESNITFDLNGNIKTYTRRGLVTAPSTYGVIDQLTYTYGDAARLWPSVPLSMTRRCRPERSEGSE